MNFTREQKAGQRLMVGFDGVEMDGDLRYLIDTLKVGGVILFSRNIETPDRIRRLCRDIREHAESSGQPPLFIAVDQEGGAVARLKKPHFTHFPGNPHIRTTSQARRFAEITAGELLDVGFNMNFAPVLDVVPENFEGIMKERVFGHDPETVARLGAVVIREFQKRGLMACAKHFPGIGRTTLDSHIDLPVLDTDPEDLAAFDLVPFAESFRHNVATVMLSHIRYEGIDPLWPASLSSIIAEDLLRKRMGYDGLVLTDDLDMGAVKKHYDMETSVYRILKSGIDIALICHRSPEMEAAFDLIRKFSTEPDLEAKEAESIARILRFKNLYL